MTHTLLNDIVFKIVFGRVGSEKLLCLLINALLKLSGEERVTTVTLLNPFRDKGYIDDRGAILDIKCRDGRGRQYNVEIQVASQSDYVKRALFYLASLYVEQLKSGGEYQALSRSIGISLTDFVLFQEAPELHTSYRFYDVLHERVLVPDVLEIHFIELPKFRLDTPRALQTPFEKWLHCLKYSPMYEHSLDALPPELRDEEGIAMALEAMRDAYARDDVRQMLELREKALHDEATRRKALEIEVEERVRAEEREAKAQLQREREAAEGQREAAKAQLQREREAAEGQREAAKAQLQREREAAEAQLQCEREAAEAQLQREREGALQQRRQIASQLLATGMDRTRVLEITQLTSDQLPE